MIHQIFGRTLWSTAALAYVMLTIKVRADLVQYEFTGVVTSAYDTTGLWAGVPAVGDLMNTTFSDSGSENLIPFNSPESFQLNVHPSTPNAGLITAGPLISNNEFWVVNIADARVPTRNDRITFYTYDPFRYANYASYLSVEWAGSSDQFDGYDVVNDWKTLLGPGTASKFVMTYLLAPVTIGEDGSRSFNLDSPAARVQGMVTAIEILPPSAPVPEASTYSITAAISLLGLASWRRFHPSKKTVLRN